MTTLQATETIPVPTPAAARWPGHLVLLTNYIPPYAGQVYKLLHERVEKFTILLSTPMEADRKWQPDYGNLNVHCQKTTTLKRPRKHVLGFKDTTWVHIPWDTVSRLKQLQPDLIVSHEFGLRSLFAARYAQKYKVPLAYWLGLSEHTEKGKGLHRWLLRKWLMKRGDAALVIGESGKRYLQKLGFRPEQIHRTHYAALPQIYERGTDQRDPVDVRRLLFVGRFIEFKGLIPFLKVLCSWAEKNPLRQIKFDLVGSGPVELELRSYPLPGNVRLQFLGDKTCEELVECYRSAGIFVFPSLADDWGLVVNEALASGLPVLGSLYSQAADELVEEGETGWRFRPDHPEEVENALDRAWNTPEERLAEMRILARAKVSHLTPEFSTDEILRSLSRIYDRFHGRLKNS